MISPDLQRKLDAWNMSLEEILNSVVEICIKHDVEHVYLFGSYATGTARPTSDIDIVIKGGRDIDLLREEVDRIPTLKTIDLFIYNQKMNPYLREDIDRYAVELPLKR